MSKFLFLHSPEYKEFHNEILHNFNIQCSLLPDLLLELFETLKYCFQNFESKEHHVARELKGFLGYLMYLQYVVFEVWRKKPEFFKNIIFSNRNSENNMLI